MSSRKVTWLSVAAIGIAITITGGCADPAHDDDLLEISAEPNQDALPGGLFHDFIADGKYDAAGHPQGAEVFEGQARCAPTTGAVGVRGIGASRGEHPTGVLCGAETANLGDGTFALNVRALMVDGAKSANADDVLMEIVVLDGEEVLATREITATDFGAGDLEQDLAVHFRHRGDSPVRFEVRWPGVVDIRLSYVEVFRSTPRLVVSPSSQPLPLGDGSTFEIEMQDPPDDMTFAVACDDTDLTERIDGLIESGEAELIDTEFRRVLRAPADLVLEGCATPSKVRVHAMVGGWATETSRVTYYGEPIPCAYTSGDSDRVRVLITGFEPFPADSDRDNSSKEAVDAYVAGEIPDNIAVMRAVLPVEYDAASALVDDLIDRCAPDVVVGFGQGRGRVDLERIAYNRKDTAAVAGGVPDNRGVVYGGDPIVDGGPAERETALPVEVILTGLEALEIRSGPSTDPGRYVCNNLFYTIMTAVTEARTGTGGFVHLPRIPTVDESDRETLRQTVATVIDETVATLTAAAAR